jgi:hypothetical protein
MIEGSSVSLIYDVDGPDELDIANHAVISKALFSSAANATPGECEVHLRDMDRDLWLKTGKRIKLLIDDQPMWAGFTKINDKGSFLPAGDGKVNTMARKWILRGVDNNTLGDFRILYNSANVLRKIPNITTPTYDDVILKQALSTYSDMPSWLDIDTFIDRVVIPSDKDGNQISTVHPWAWVQQGSKIRAVFEDLALWSAAVWYFGPDDAVHYHAVQDRECPWGFSDRPPLGDKFVSSAYGFEGVYTGFREMNAEEDGSQYATDAFVWGGSPIADTGTTVFHRATDPTLEAEHGKWQWAETHFNETNFKLQAGVTQRANVIVFGNPDGDASGAEPGTVAGEGPRGLRFSQWNYSFQWSTKDVPYLGSARRHLYPGDIVPIQLWAFSEDGGTTPFTKLLPLRQLQISFPSGAKDGKAHVQFNGTFDLRNDDSKFLWRFLRARETKLSSYSVAGVTDASSNAAYGGFGQFTPIEAPDGVRTVFHIKFPYIPNTTQLYADTGSGLTLRIRGPLPLGYYQESDPDTAELTLNAAPAGGTTLYVTCRTQAA